LKFKKLIFHKPYFFLPKVAGLFNKKTKRLTSHRLIGWQSIISDAKVSLLFLNQFIFEFTGIFQLSKQCKMFIEVSVQLLSQEKAVAVKSWRSSFYLLSP